MTTIERDRKLGLRAEMKTPGEALLEFCIERRSTSQCTLRQSAFFKPRALLGLAYWYAVAPLHHLVFRGMLRGIRREAVRIASGETKHLQPEEHRSV